MPSASCTDDDNRPPARARSSAESTNTLPTVSPVRSATAAATSMEAPDRRDSAASHTQHATPKEAVPVSTSRTGTSLPAAASRALFSVPDTADPMWMDRISVAPRSAIRA